MAKQRFDIMVGDRYYTTFTYHYTPGLEFSEGGKRIIEVIDLDDVARYVKKRFQSLKGKQYTIAFSECSSSLTPS